MATWVFLSQHLISISISLSVSLVVFFKLTYGSSLSHIRYYCLFITTSFSLILIVFLWRRSLSFSISLFLSLSLHCISDCLLWRISQHLYSFFLIVFLWRTSISFSFSLSLLYFCDDAETGFSLSLPPPQLQLHKNKEMEETLFFFKATQNTSAEAF